MKETTLTIKIEPELREKIILKAKKERRSIGDETAYLMEIGLKAIERQQAEIAKILAGNTNIDRMAFIEQDPDLASLPPGTAQPKAANG
jgi:predicted transcriptional regulator